METFKWKEKGQNKIDIHRRGFEQNMHVQTCSIQVNDIIG